MQNRKEVYLSNLSVETFKIQILIVLEIGVSKNKKNHVEDWVLD